ncbi:MAG: trypsin-like peptidase domain-containing protein [Acholeplasmatales bacterium]|nr:trypsin-like peptidase domain-containing protein [Acholeplasmatales bacterium]
MFKKLIVGILSIGLLFSLASCNGNNIDIYDNSSSTEITNANVVDGNGSSGSSNTQKLDADYKKTTAQYEISNTVNSSSVADTVEEVYESVVSITALSVSSGSRGSGVLFAQDLDLGLSYIVTCFHVIEGATEFTVTIPDYNSDYDGVVNPNAGEYTAKLVGGYEDQDLAILSIEKTGLTYSKIYSDSNKLRYGDDVICIGNPLGTLPGSVAKGVVSYVNREVKKDSYQSIKLIQTDVAINSGNSGGGLFNASGALIGIVNGKYQSSSIEGLGFAIPSNTVKSTIDSILSTAEYDVNNKEWKTGYVEGDFEFGFTISLGTTQASMFGRSSYALYISSTESSSYYSGTNLTKNTVISSISINYKDTSKSTKTYTVPTSLSSTSATEATTFLYEAGLAIGDSVTFTYSDGSTSSFEIVQFRYVI